MPDAARGKRRWPRWLALALAFCVTFVGTGRAVVAGLDAVHTGYRLGTLEVLSILFGQLGRIDEGPGQRRVVYLGDSLAMDTKPPDRSIPVQLMQALMASAGSASDLRLRRVVGSGLGLFSQYFLSSAVAERRPDQVVLALNLHWFSQVWYSLEREQLAALLPVRSWPTALRLPLARADVTADRLLLYRSLLRGGGFRAWLWLQRQQVRALHAKAALAEWLQAASPFPNGLGYQVQHRYWALARDGAARATRGAIRRQLGSVLAGLPAGDPGLRVLDAVLATYEAGGIPVLLYVAPLNVDHLRELGVLDEAGLARTLARIEAVARAHGAEFLDLHDLLEDACFRDSIDHLSHDDAAEGPHRVAMALFPYLRVDAAPASPDGA